MIVDSLHLLPFISADGAQGLINGDVLPRPKKSGSEIEKRNAVRDKSRLWKNGVVPYVFGLGLSK